MVERLGERILGRSEAGSGVGIVETGSEIEKEIMKKGKKYLVELRR